MDEVERQVSDLKAAAERLAAEQQKLVAQAEAAGEDEQRLLTKLREEFGVSSIEEAQTLLDKINAQLSAEMSTVREQLAAARRPEGT